MDDKEQPTVLIACKRTKSVEPGKTAQSSADRYDQHCDSKMAYQMESHGPGVVTYKCIKCGHVWSTSVGGQFVGI